MFSNGSHCTLAPGEKLFSHLALGALFLFASLFLFLPASAQNSQLSEYRAKAAFLAAFPKFIEWPSEAFPSERSPFLLCVYGDFSFGTSLAELTRAVSLHGRTIEVRWARNEQDLRFCHLLFVSHSEARHYAKVFKAIEGGSVLTVGETPDFLASGGAIDFVLEEDHLQFEVSVINANEAHLRISSSMLALARHVVTKIEPAKASVP